MSLNYFFDTDHYVVQGGCGDSEIIIPDYYDDGINGYYPVTIISSFAFFSCSSLNKIIIGKNVNFINYASFGNCVNLKTIIFKSKDINIYDYVFANCFALLDVFCEGNVLTNGFGGPLDATAFYEANASFKFIRKKHFVTGWSSTLIGRPVVLWSDNVIKSGGTGKLIGLPRTYYYLFDSYEFTVNGFNFYITGPMRPISESERAEFDSFFYYPQVVGQIYRSTFSNFIVNQIAASIGPPGGPFSTYYTWNILYFNFNDSEDLENGRLFYNSDLDSQQKNLENISIWYNNDTFESSTTPYAFKIKRRFPNQIQVKNSLVSLRNGIYNIKNPDISYPYISPPVYEKKNELGIVISEISSYYYNDSVIFYIDSFDFDAGYYYYNETDLISVNDINSSKIHPYQFNPYYNFYTDDPSILDDPNIEVISIN